MRSIVRQRRKQVRWARIVPFLILSLAVHVVVGLIAEEVMPWFMPELNDAAANTTLVILQPPPDNEEEDELEEEDEITGQIVDLAPPEESKRPDDAEYLSAFDIDVEEEMKSERFELNPEVIAPEWSEESTMQNPDLMESNVDKPSTGATVGQDRFDPDRDGALENLPSDWTFTNKDGLQDPIAASHLNSQLSGAPQNDLLDEDRGDRVALDAKEYLYHEYISRIRQIVGYYWDQNVDNTVRSVPLARSSYRTETEVILNSDGAVEVIEVTGESGSPELDDCVVRAFRMAGPFPNPPSGLIERDGRVYLPSMGWTLQLSTARLRFSGVDPRSGVEYPGLHKSPR